MDAEGTARTIQGGDGMKVPKYFYFRVKTVNHGTAVEVEDASDTDVAEVTRCKDCKHHWTHKFEICELGQTFYDAEVDYCSLAERREVTE